MAIVYYVPRIIPQSAVSWTGDNFAEINGLFPGLAVDNGDGTLTVSRGFQYAPVTLTVGQWIYSPAPNTAEFVFSDHGPADNPATSVQILSSSGPWDYDLTAGS